MSARALELNDEAKRAAEAAILVFGLSRDEALALARLEWRQTSQPERLTAASWFKIISCGLECDQLFSGRRLRLVKGGRNETDGG